MSCKERIRLFQQAALLTCMSMMSEQVAAKWSVNFDNRLYYTDDVALFSVTRRLSLKEDPTQPIVDRPAQGGDFVYEPKAQLTWSGNNVLGEANVLLNAASYVFTEQSA